MNRYDGDDTPFGLEGLEVYQAARSFRNRVYSLIKMLPAEEKFALAQQMRRAAVSVTSNIAAGYGRHHWQENTQFCRHARGSLMERIDHVNVCQDQGYAQPEHLADLKDKDGLSLLKLLNGYIAYLQKQKSKPKS